MNAETNAASAPARTRFAPSPTGHLHLGNARTALFNWLLARKLGGRFVLRLEDTDAERSDPKFSEALYTDLRWLGLEWDEGPQAGAAQPPGGSWAQSERGAIYREHYARLERAGRVYPCFCSKEKLARARAAQRAAGKPPRYPGTCAALDPAEAARRLEAGESATLRFRVPAGRTVVFEDLVRGRQEFASDDIGDFVIRRADGTPAFFFSNALDDALMGITHVLRGEDHLANTPRQILLLEALELPVPDYGHIPLVLAEGGGPLSKRAGAISVQHYREKGVLPVALMNYLARVGHHYSDESLQSPAQLAAGFRIEAIGKAPAHFDPQHLEHWQREAVLALDAGACRDWLGRALERAPEAQREALARALQPNVLYPFEASQWGDILYGPGFYYSQPAGATLREAGAEFFRAARQAVEEHGTDYAAITAALKEKTGTRGKALFAPLRFALTGRSGGPELAALFALLGRERLLERFAKAEQQAGQ